MQFKVLLFAAFISVINAGLLPESTTENYDTHPSYNFKYSVDDSITGDVKAQSETRDGDNVQGQYTLNDADGYKRIVDYTSDAVNGLKVTVRRERLQSGAPKASTTKEAVSKPAIVIPEKSKLIIPKATTTTVVHHHEPTVYHHAPQTVHFLHTSPSASIVKSAPALIATTHHHTPAVLHHSPTVVHHAPATVVHHTPALVKATIGAPHQVSYVHYH